MSINSPIAAEQYALAMEAAHNAFLASAGRPPLADVDDAGVPTGDRTRMTTKWKSEYAAMAAAISANAIVSPLPAMLSSGPGAPVTGVGSII